MRRLSKFGNNIYIALPREWLEKHNLKPEDEVPIVADTVLKIVPANEI